MDVANHKLMFTASGDPANPLLIMIHGWLSHRGVWRTTIPALQDRFYCIAVDLLGFGDNVKPIDGDYSIAMQAQRIVALADELGFKTFSLMGHSMGRQIATYVAAITTPERVERLVNVGGVATGRLAPFVENFIGPLSRLGPSLPALYDLMGGWSEKYRWYANFIFRSWFYDMNFEPFELWKIDRQMASQPSMVYSAPKAYDALFATNLTNHLAHVRAKTLVISGKQDGTVPAEQAQLLKEHVTNAELILYDLCGHFPMFERTDAYLAALNTFFAQ